MSPMTKIIRTHSLKMFNFVYNESPKVLTIVGTRPEIIRLSRIIRRLENSSSVDHKLLHTGQNYDHELNEIFKDLELRNPDYFFDTKSSSFADTLSKNFKPNR